MKKINVMFISHDTGRGGSAKSLTDMLVKLREYIVPIVVLPAQGDAVLSLKELNIEYYIIPFKLNFGEIGCQSDEKNDLIFVNNYESVKRLINIAIDKKIQIIHSNSSVIAVGAMLSVVTNIPHVWHIREFLEEDFNREIYDKNLYGNLFKFTDKFITISKSVQKAFYKKYGIESLQIYDGIDIEGYDIKKCDGTREKNSFLLAGYFQEGKGQWEVVYAVEKLINKGINNIHVYMVGAGERRYIWCLQQYIKKNNLDKYITILPYQQDLAELRKKCQFSITASRMEGLGRITIEAMLAGNIVIGANTGGTLEIIGENGERGYLYQQGLPEDLADVMKRVIELTDLGIIIDKDRIRKEIKDVFNNDKYAKCIYQIYRDILNNNVIDRRDERERFGKCLDLRYNKIKKNQIAINNFENKEIVAKERALLNDKWDSLRQRGGSLYSVISDMGVKNIAIYGMGVWGYVLYEELQETDIKVDYVIDKNKEYLDRVVNVLNIEDNLPCVDIIIVTILGEEDIIREKLQSKGSYRIVMLSELIKKAGVENECG